jgi:hypothetical protein
LGSLADQDGLRRNFGGAFGLSNDEAKQPFGNADLDGELGSATQSSKEFAVDRIDLSAESLNFWHGTGPPDFGFLRSP